MARTPRSPRLDLRFPPVGPLSPAAPATASAAGWERHRVRPSPAVRPALADGGAGAVSDGTPRLRPSADAERGDAAEPVPVRLAAPTAASPFAPGREVAFARVEGDLLARLGVRDGDHVALWRRDVAEPGDLAAVLDARGRAGLWRVYPERDELRLTTGDPACARRSGRHPRVQGVVVAVHRSFGVAPATSPVAGRRRAEETRARPERREAAVPRARPASAGSSNSGRVGREPTGRELTGRGATGR